mgnify:CR=1 FL=1
MPQEFAALPPVAPTEETIRRMNRLTMAAGLNPLSAAEIEPFLEQLSPPTSLPGVRPSPPDTEREERRTISALAKAQRFGGTPAIAGMGGAASALQGAMG